MIEVMEGNVSFSIKIASFVFHKLANLIFLVEV
jgi:hypothetical protein